MVCWDSNLGRQDGRRRRINWAMAAPQCIHTVCIHTKGIWPFCVGILPKIGKLSKVELSLKVNKSLIIIIVELSAWIVSEEGQKTIK